MQKQKIPYEKCVFVCVNDRQGEKPSCGDQKGEEVFRKLREIARERGLHPRIRVTQVKCLGQCATGTTVMVTPENVWYQGVTLEHCGDMAEKIFSGDHPDQ